MEEEAVTQGVGFEPPPQPHKHWHVDVSYINLSGTFYTYGVCWTGYSRFLVHWDLRESMKEAYAEAQPRVISANGSQLRPLLSRACPRRP